MSETVIKVENLSKQYRLGEIGTGTIREDFSRFWARIRGKGDPTLKIGQTNVLNASVSVLNQNVHHHDYVWALKDINFEVKQGEVLGIIGKNGAGKSTLLKILSKVTAPTTGCIKIKGRIASLLEVGTGFHPELSGRENIFLNGAILGMTKAEIKSKFDEIVDFSGVERYVDTPVKRYSSGMYVRLAFAVAAHLEPEILIVDEVLAVGDAEFQKKALGKMKAVSKTEGRTVLFVSHNMAAVKSLCSHCILLKNGLMEFNGDVATTISNYVSNNVKAVNHKIWENPQILSNEFEIKEAFIKVKNKNIEDVFEISDELELVIKIINKTSNHRIDATVHLKDGNGERIFSMGSTIIPEVERKGLITYSCTIPANFFNVGNFSLDLFIVKNKKFDIYNEPDILGFTMINSSVGIGEFMGYEPGAIHPVFEWKIK